MERRNCNILIALITVVIVAAVFSSFGLSLFGNATPEIVLPTQPPVESQPQGGEDHQGGARVEVTPDTVQSVIAALSRLESYSRVVTTTMAGETATAQVWVDGGWTRTNLDRTGRPTTYTIVGENTVWRWYAGDDQAVFWDADEASADVDGQYIPTYEDVLNLDRSAITAAGYEEKNGGPCVFVEVSIPELGQVERYWVSAVNGLLSAAETVVGEEIVYSMEAGVPDIPAPAGSFMLPDGTVLHRIGE